MAIRRRKSQLMDLEWADNYKSFTSSDFAAGWKLLGKEFPAVLQLVTHPGSGQERIPSTPGAMLRLLKHLLSTKQLPKGVTLDYDKHKPSGVKAYVLRFTADHYILGFSFVGSEGSPKDLKFFWRWMPRPVLVHAEGF